MTAIVQANCPHCNNPLRIPAEWVGQAMRCKFCQNTFEARVKSSDTPLPANVNIMVAAPVARPAILVGKAVHANGISAGAAPAAPSPLAFDPGPVVHSSVRQRSGGKGFLIAGCAVLGLVVAVPVTLFLLLVLGAFGNVGFFFVGGLDGKGADAWPKEDDGPPLPIAQDAPKKDNAPGKDFVGKDLGVKDRPAKDKDKKLGKDKVVVGPKGGGLLPRRALLINVNNYLYLNSLDHANKSRVSLSGLQDFVFTNPPLKVPASQIFRLSDDGPNPHPTELSVIKNAIKDFLDTSRAQDRVVILFAGHATDIEKDSYLIPINGRKDDPDTLLPLKWVYDQMAECKARQKILILDVFRFPPARGFELPGAGASDEGDMGEVFDGHLNNPPAGVQVLSSCIKEQRSIEFEGGSIFLQSLDQTLRGGPAFGFIEGPTPLPFDQTLVDKINKKMKEMIGTEKYVQTARLTGAAPATGAAYDPSEVTALPIALKQPVIPGGKSASYAEIDGILNEIRMVPAPRSSRATVEDRLLKAVNLPRFDAKVLSTYRPDDYKFLTDLLDQHKKDPKKLADEHPIRSVVLDAIDTLQKNAAIRIREDLPGPVDPKQKAAFLKEQQEPGILIFELEKMLAEMNAVADESMDKETSKRWRANFEYTRARLLARLVYVYEYSYILGQIRLDTLPPLDNGANGWRVGSRKKIQVTEPKAKAYAKEAASAWKDIQKKYPDTPWAVLAYRESLVALGLEWKAKKE